MGGPFKYDAGAYYKTLACGAANGVAAGAGDNTAVTGAGIDTLGYGTATLCIAYKTTLTDAATLSFAVSYQVSSDNSSWDTAVVLQASTVAKTGSSTTNFVSQLEFDLSLLGLKRYLRFNYTPDLSAGSADVFVTAAVAVLAGPDAIPAV